MANYWNPPPFHDTVRMKSTDKVRVRVKNVSGEDMHVGDNIIWGFGSSGSEIMTVEYHADTAQATMVRVAGCVDDEVIVHGDFGHITIDGIMAQIKVFHGGTSDHDIANGSLLKLADNSGAVPGCAMVVAAADENKSMAFAIAGEAYAPNEVNTNYIKGAIMPWRV